MRAGTLERVEAINSGPPITCAAGNDDRSRADPLTVGQLQTQPKTQLSAWKTSPKLGLQFIGSRVEDFQKELFVVHWHGLSRGADKVDNAAIALFLLRDLGPTPGISFVSNSRYLSTCRV